MGVLGIDDEAFFVDPFAERAAVIDRLADEGAEGIALDAPTRVRCDLRSDVPLAGARRLPGSKAKAQRFRELALLIIAREDSGEVFAERAFAWKEPARRSPEPPPEETSEEPSEEPDGDPDGAPLTEPMVTDFFLVQARQRIARLPMRPATLHATIVCGPERSNTVTVRVEGAPEQNPVVTDFIAQYRSPGYPRAVSPPPIAEASTPSYARVGGSPAEPVGVGIALALPAEASGAEGSRCELHGAFALPLRERELVRAFDAHLDRFARSVGAGWVDVGDPAATAVVPVTLVVAADRVEEPAVLRIDAPVYHELPGGAGTLARGHFSLDLFALLDMPRTPGRYYLWAISGDVLVGPHPLTIA